jgi:hypothetical protein
MMQYYFDVKGKHQGKTSKTPWVATCGHQTTRECSANSLCRHSLFRNNSPIKIPEKKASKKEKMSAVCVFSSSF